MSKKIFLSLMVMAAMLMAGTAIAGEMHTKIYGKAHVSTESLNNGEDSSIFMSSNSTRVGIKGKYATDVEAFTVIFQFESNANFNGETNNVLSSRNSYAGLMGNWGKAIWGRHDSPVKTLSRKVDFFADRIGDSRNLTRFDINYMDDDDTPKGFDERYANMIMYVTPKLADAITVALQYVPEEGKDSNMSVFSGNAVWHKNALLVGVGYETHGKGYYGFNAGDDSPENQAIESAATVRAIAGWTGEKFAIKGLYQNVSNVGGIKEVSGMAYGLGASFDLGTAWVLRGQYYAMDYSFDTDEGQVEPTDTGNAMFALGVDYVLNEKALIYLAYAASMNQDNAYNTPFRGGHGQDYRMGVDDEMTRNGESPYGIALGMIAKF